MKEMDKFFKEKLYDHPSQISVSMWDRIESEMKEEKGRDYAFWWFFGVAALVALTIPVFADFFHSPAEENEAAKVNKEIVVNNFDPLPEHSENIHSLQTVENQDSNEPEKPFEIQSKASISLQQNINRPDMPALEPNSIVSENKAFIDPNPLMHIEKKAEREIIEKEYFRFSELNSTLSPLDIPLKIFKDPIGCPTFQGRNPTNIFIEGNLTPMLASPLLSSNSPEIGQDYLNLRKTSENSLFSWAAGINIGWISKYNIGAKAGVNYEMINERFYYEDPEAIRNQTVITIDTLFNPDGSFTVNMDTSVVQVNGYETQSIHNYHKTVNIPIQILYQLDFDKIDIEFSGGPIFNINYSNRGKILDPSSNDRWFTNRENESYRVFRDRLSWSLNVSVSLMYMLNENIQLYVRPNLKYHPNPISTNTSPFNQRYLNSGLSVGTRYYFSGNPNY